MKPLSPIDMIDSGADDNEPVKQVTHGHLRQWHDMIANMHNLIETLNDDCRTWSSDYDDLGARLDAEKKIVDRVWKALGITTFVQACGKAVFEIVAEQKAALEEIAELSKAQSHPCGPQEYNHIGKIAVRVLLSPPPLPNWHPDWKDPMRRQSS